jgi:putative glycosyltransferase (exosortase G-associated)
VSDALISLALFWGVWLLAPILVDGIGMGFGLIGAILSRRLMRHTSIAPDYAPTVTVIVPVHNSADTLRGCLETLEAQTYPRERMQVILIHNGSIDDSEQIAMDYQQDSRLNLFWHSTPVSGKSWALNAGIHLAEGQYIINVDADVVLAADTIERTVAHFEADTRVGAITGFIEIAPDEEDHHPAFQQLLNCEYLEYLTVFGVGRSYQSLFNAIYTLSGAYTAFRREALAATLMYSAETVSEDTDLTFQIYERSPKYRVANFPDVRIQVQPVPSLQALYSQRLRWQRGQLEVSALHKKLVKRKSGSLFGFSPARTLLVDHTLAFPRLVWLFFLPVLTGFGYSLSLMAAAYAVMYLFYLGVELAWVGGALLYADEQTRRRVRHIWASILLMPFYRLLVYFFRFSGFLNAMTEPAAWRTPSPLWQLQAGLLDLRARLRFFVAALRERVRREPT